MRILIVGAGIGGLSLASFLNKFDIDFDILDKATDWNQQGYSIGLWDNGRDMLKKLGLDEKLDKEGQQIHDFFICNGKGKILKTYDLRDFCRTYSSTYTLIDRVILHSWLVTLVGGDRIKMNSTISSLNEAKDYDVVVGADGIHSRVRNLTFFDEDYEHYSEWRVWFTRVGHKFQKEKSIVQYIEPKQFVSLFDDGEKTLAVLISPARQNEWDKEKGRVERLKKTFNKHPVVSEMLTDVQDSDVTPTDLSFVEMKNWVKGNVALLGDAAHALEPFAGLGASMAMEDAYVLAGELFKACKGAVSTEEALIGYETRRKERITTAKHATKKMRWWSIYKSSLLQDFINFMTPYAPTSYFTRDFRKLLDQEI